MHWTRRNTLYVIVLAAMTVSHWNMSARSFRVGQMPNGNINRCAIAMSGRVVVDLEMPLVRLLKPLQGGGAVHFGLQHWLPWTRMVTE